MLYNRYREAFADRENVFRAPALLFAARRVRTGSGVTPNIAIIFAARLCGIPNTFAVSSRDKGLKSSLTGRRIFDLFLI
jgi:hypothetical protein